MTRGRLLLALNMAIRALTMLTGGAGFAYALYVASFLYTLTP